MGRANLAVDCHGPVLAEQPGCQHERSPPARRQVSATGQQARLATVAAGRARLGPSWLRPALAAAACGRAIAHHARRPGLSRGRAEPTSSTLAAASRPSHPVWHQRYIPRPRSPTWSTSARRPSSRRRRRSRFRPRGIGHRRVQSTTSTSSASTPAPDGLGGVPNLGQTPPSLPLGTPDFFKHQTRGRIRRRDHPAASLKAPAGQHAHWGGILTKAEINDLIASIDTLKRPTNGSTTYKP